MLRAGVPSPSKDVSPLRGIETRKSSDLKERNWTWFLLEYSVCPNIA